jgi:hypothetical protein
MARRTGNRGALTLPTTLPHPSDGVLGHTFLPFSTQYLYSWIKDTPGSTTA